LVGVEADFLGGAAAEELPHRGGGLFVLAGAQLAAADGPVDGLPGGLGGVVEGFALLVLADDVAAGLADHAGGGAAVDEHVDDRVAEDARVGGLVPDQGEVVGVHPEQAVGLPHVGSAACGLPS
jgi:hypothetical protein